MFVNQTYITTKNFFDESFLIYLTVRIIISLIFQKRKKENFSLKVIFFCPLTKLFCAVLFYFAKKSPSLFTLVLKKWYFEFF